MIEGTPAITITFPIPEARRPRHLVEDEIRALGNARHAQARLVHLGAGRLHPFVQDGERARIGRPHVMTDAYRPLGGNKQTAAVAQSGNAEIGFAPAARAGGGVAG